ncbi:polyribonucleotide nucleotidyltransferase [bacterium]|nr:polyribonucleotide nucleotidyltransferase [bacterium]
MTGIKSVSREIAGRTLTLESGRIARQAGGAVVARYGDTMVFAAATMAKEAKEDQSFFPLTVDYRESRYAAGKFPGGFFKREGRPSEREILTSRCIDRPIRPMFPDNFKNETQVLLNVISYDQKNESEILGMVAAFAALEISDIPFHGPLAAVRVGKIDGELIVNPNVDDVERATLNLTIAGSKSTINMVEGGALEEPEEVFLQALELAQHSLSEICDLIEEFRAECGKPKYEVPEKAVNETLVNRVAELATADYETAIFIVDKKERELAIDTINEKVKEKATEEMKQHYIEKIDSGEMEQTAAEAEFADQVKDIPEILHDLEKKIVRGKILNDGKRSDGRGLTDIRPISCEIGYLPSVHGSAIFTRGQTQSLATTTLGTVSDEQKIDSLDEEYFKKFMLHYNFPSYSVGEVRPNRGPGRREIGHGALAERAITPILPDYDSFPYSIRAVSEIMESNGSSSMASVCGTSLSLMDAGVPVKAQVAGIAMGLVKEEEKYSILSDILGMEDHLGDMDFKVSGTRNGINAFQMDLKIEGITREIMAEALEQARQGRLHILDVMDKTIAQPRSQLSSLAPRIHVINIDVEKIRDVIGPGGKMIRKIISDTGARIDIDDEGQVVICSDDEETGRKAREWIEYLTEEVEIGRIYKGKVTRISNFGAFVEILPGQEGLVHISEMAEQRVDKVEDVVNENDEVEVKVIEIDSLGRINLSKKLADRELGYTAPEDFQDRKKSGGGGRDKDKRGGGRDRRGGDRDRDKNRGRDKERNR